MAILNYTSYLLVEGGAAGRAAAAAAATPWSQGDVDLLMTHLNYTFTLKLETPFVDGTVLRRAAAATSSADPSRGRAARKPFPITVVRTSPCR